MDWDNDMPFTDIECQSLVKEIHQLFYTIFKLEINHTKFYPDLILDNCIIYLFKIYQCFYTANIIKVLCEGFGGFYGC